MLFGRINLRESRTQYPRLPKTVARREHFLRNSILNGPRLRPVIAWAVPNHHHFEKGLVGWIVDFSLELRSKWPQALEKSYAHHFQIGVSFSVVVSDAGSSR